MTNAERDDMGMTAEERALWDARSGHEAWAFAVKILEPMTDTAEAIGHPELTELMNEALGKAFARRNAATGRIEALGAGEATPTSPRRGVPSAVNELLSKAIDLMEESHAPTEEQREEERRAYRAVCEAGMIMARLERVGAETNSGR